MQKVFKRRGARGAGGGCTNFMHGRSGMTIATSPSHSHNAATEHIGFSPTRQTLLAPKAKRREMFGESREGLAASYEKCRPLSHPPPPPNAEKQTKKYKPQVQIQDLVHTLMHMDDRFELFHFFRVWPVGRGVVGGRGTGREGRLHTATVLKAERPTKAGLRKGQ